jgi:proline racemase
MPHTAGEPFRVITAELPDLPGETIPARRRHEFVIDSDDPLKEGFMLK